MSVIFRRVHGRVIPINSDNRKDAAKGAALAGTGLAVGGVAGSVAGELAKKGLHNAKASFNAEKAAHTHGQTIGKGSQMDMLKPNRAAGYMRGRMAASETFKLKAVKYGAYSKAVARAGQVASTTLIAGGVDTALKHTRLKDKEGTRQGVAVASGAAATFTIQSFFKSHLSDSVTQTKAMKKFFKDAGKAIVKAAIRKKVL